MGDARGRGGEDLNAIGQVRSQPLRILLSYFYYKDCDLARVLGDAFGDAPVEVFADSGAFSAYTQGKAIDDGAYILWVNKWKSFINVAAGPDVIGDPVATRSATLKMQQRVTGVPVLPTFHVGDDWSYLDFWCNRPSDYIALGGMVPYTRKLKLLGSWCKKAFSRIPPTTKVHGFGMTTWSLLLKFPWYSVDSSSWTSGFRYAQLSLFDDRRGRFVSISLRDRKALLSNSVLLARYGLRPSQLQADSYDRNTMVRACVESWWRAEEWIKSFRSKSPQTYLVSKGAGLSTLGEAFELRTHLVSSSDSPSSNNSLASLGEALGTKKEST